MTRSLNVFLYDQKVGKLSEDNVGYLEFQYANDAKWPISVRMPVRQRKYDRRYAEPFFDNLTPEGDALKLIADKFHISNTNIFSVLDKIGGECAGAISLYPDDIPPSDEDLLNITDDKLVKIIDELPQNPLLTGIEGAPRLSLAGAQSKFAVVKGADGRYYCSTHTKPTTHIIKIANKYYPELLNNELFCMKLAASVLSGEGAVPVELHETHGRKYLEIERYDRQEIKEPENGKWTKANHENMTFAYPVHIERVHQEDFCQVLGCLERRKYQKDRGPGIRDIYGAIMQYSTQPANDAYRFIELVMFNYLIGNTDAHAKNFSILHKNHGENIVLAPAYDLISVEAYPESKVSHEIAMFINGKGKYDAVTKKCWLALYEQLGLNPARTLQEMKAKFGKVLEAAKSLRDELNADDLTKSEIYDKILTVIEKRYAAIIADRD